MRWILAGFAFTLLIGLAVVTTTIRSSSIALRRDLRITEQRCLSYSIERARWLEERGDSCRLDPLAERWQAWRQIEQERALAR